ncbi:tetratricopeptide repeat protein [Halioxenophilus aromaticivorans]|uniref:Tetratricopeptide repeat protein n=1 Tax=Halioxenophilus aromaticivorans TaxID=1306992 RepID=A0AAV3U1P0_9ALTE
MSWQEPLKVFIGLILLGFPVALIFAWAFELTPEGVKLTESVADGESIHKETGKKLEIAILVGIGLIVALFGYQQFTASDSSVTTNSATNYSGNGPAAGVGGDSIAVLPFVDLSPDGDQEYFSDGISEEILNVLVRIPKLKVAGRTSSFSFKGKNQDLRDIGAALNVDHVLEGSVRKAGARLRITAQLIRSNDGFHVWSETYDRELTDIFAIQDDIAKNVADAMAKSLGIAAGQSLVGSRTDDPIAYDNYLKAHELYRQRGEDNLRKARNLLADAIARDPNFADAWAEMGLILETYPWYVTGYRYDNSELWASALDAAEQMARRALAIDPENVQALSVLGEAYTQRHDYVRAFEYYDRISALGANIVVLGPWAQTLIQVGYFDEAEKVARASVAVDPLNAIEQNSLGWSLAVQGRYDDAMAVWSNHIDRDTEYRITFPYFNLARLFIVLGRYQDANDLIERVFKNSPNYSESEREQNLASMANLRKLAAGDLTPDEYVKIEGDPVLAYTSESLIKQLNEPAPAVKKLEALWLKDDVELKLFMLTNDSYEIAFQNPTWQQAVRDSGVLKLWQARGFPYFCEAKGEDDFQCYADRVLRKQT